MLVGFLPACRAGDRIESRRSVSEVPVGTSTGTLDVAGTERTYRLYRPRSVPASAPLVVVLHGGLGSGRQAEEAYGWDPQADRGGFVVAYPDGLNRAWAVTADCCGPPARDGVDDVAFITALVGAVAERMPIDADRVYATGISNGGLLSYRLACETDTFAAIGPVAATLLGPCDDPARLSVLHIHGTADRTIPYGGGPGKRETSGDRVGPVHIDGPAAPDVVARWRAVDDCAPPTTRTDGAVTTSIASCPDGRAVGLITVAGAGHQWPGSGPAGRAERALGLDEPAPAPDATAALWAFFAAHTR